MNNLHQSPFAMPWLTGIQSWRLIVYHIKLRE
jgi:hypothetical protein